MPGLWLPPGGKPLPGGALAQGEGNSGVAADAILTCVKQWPWASASNSSST